MVAMMTFNIVISVEGLNRSVERQNDHLSLNNEDDSSDSDIIEELDQDGEDDGFTPNGVTFCINGRTYMFWDGRQIEPIEVATIRENGITYVFKNGSWVELREETTIDVNNTTYVFENGQWREIMDESWLHRRPGLGEDTGEPVAKRARMDEEYGDDFFNYLNMHARTDNMD